MFFDGVYKRGLAVLSAEILGRIIQSDGLLLIILLFLLFVLCTVVIQGW